MSAVSADVQIVAIKSSRMSRDGEHSMSTPTVAAAHTATATQLPLWLRLSAYLRRPPPQLPKNKKPARWLMPVS
jgi:hypothetical protein